jgi:hypothetical protein
MRIGRANKTVEMSLDTADTNVRAVVFSEFRAAGVA